MNWIMETITRMCNLQRDRMFRKQEEKKKTVRKGSGFDQILRKEEERYDIPQDRGQDRC